MKKVNILDLLEQISVLIFAIILSLVGILLLLVIITLHLNYMMVRVLHILLKEKFYAFKVMVIFTHLMIR